jgi:hypothetical protein
LQPGHLIHVLSTDQHTVKSWFDGELEFIPLVWDFLSKDFGCLVEGQMSLTVLV